VLIMIHCNLWRENINNKTLKGLSPRVGLRWPKCDNPTGPFSLISFLHIHDFMECLVTCSTGAPADCFYNQKVLIRGGFYDPDSMRRRTNQRHDVKRSYSVGCNMQPDHQRALHPTHWPFNHATKTHWSITTTTTTITSI